MSEEELVAAIAKLIGVKPARITIYSERIGEIDGASFTVTVKQLSELQLLVGAPVTIESSDSDHATCTYGHTAIRWEPS